MTQNDLDSFQGHFEHHEAIDDMACTIQSIWEPSQLSDSFPDSRNGSDSRILTVSTCAGPSGGGSRHHKRAGMGSRSPCSGRAAGISRVESTDSSHWVRGCHMGHRQIVSRAAGGWPRPCACLGWRSGPCGQSQFRYRSGRARADLLYLPLGFGGWVSCLGRIASDRGSLAKSPIRAVESGCRVELGDPAAPASLHGEV